MDFTEIVTVHFWSSVVSIILLDLVLAGDNAVVIALAARGLDKKIRNKAIYFGTAGAVVIRTLMTLAAVWLLSIPYLQAIGGIVLVPVAYHLLKPAENTENVQSANTFWGAIRTIIVADAVMGIDNVLAVAGAAHGDFLLVIFGLLFSVPIVVCGSRGIGVLMDRYPILIWLGAGLIAWTAGSMIAHDKMVSGYIQNVSVMLYYLIPVLTVAGVIIAGFLRKK